VFSQAVALNAAQDRIVVTGEYTNISDFVTARYLGKPVVAAGSFVQVIIDKYFS